MISKVSHSCSDEVYYIFGHDGLAYLLEVDSRSLNGLSVEGKSSPSYNDTQVWFYGEDGRGAFRDVVIAAFWKEMENA